MLPTAGIVNRASAIILPFMGITASFLTLIIHGIQWEDSLKTALAIASDTYLWITTIAGLLLLAADFRFPQRRNLILGFSITISVLVTAFAWIVGNALMYI
jgi:hypothetical protein